MTKSYAKAGGWIGLIFGVVIFNAVISNMFFASSSDNGINWIELICAGLFAMLTSGVGTLIGQKMSKSSTFESGDAESIDTKNNDTSGPRGLDGWLIVLGGVLVLSFLSQSSDFYDVYINETPFFLTKEVFDLNRSFAWYFSISAIGSIFLYVFTIIALILFFLKSQKFPIALILFFATSVLVYLCNAMAINSVGQVAPEVLAQIYGQLFGGCVAAAIWISYVKKSKRVKNTFV